MFTWITDLLRSLVWSIGHGALIVSDWLMDLMQLTFAINLGSNNDVWTFFRVILVIMTVFTPIFAFIYYFKWIDDRDSAEFQSSKLVRRMVRMALTVVLLPTVFTFMMSFSQKTDQWTSSWLGYDEQFTPSEMILTNTATSKIQSDYTKVSGSNKTLKLEDFDVNKKSSDDDEKYSYYNGWVELFFGVAIAIAMIYIMFMNFLPFFIRFVLILFKVILAPIPLAHSIIPTSNAYEDWLKGLSVDVMLNAIQLFGLKVVLILFGFNGLFKQETSLIRAIFLIVALYAVGQVPDLFASFFGLSDKQANAGLKAGLQARGLKGMVTGAIGMGAIAGNTLAGAGAYGGQKVGQALGGKSLNELESQGIISENNPLRQSGKTFGGGSSADHFQPENQSGMSFSNRSENMSNEELLGSDRQSVGGNTFDREFDPSETPEEERLTRSGTRARSFADNIENMGGISGKIVRGFSRSGKHAYLGMARRANRTTARQIGKTFTQDPLKPLGHASTNKGKNKSSFNNDFSKGSFNDPLSSSLGKSSFKDPNSSGIYQDNMTSSRFEERDTSSRFEERDTGSRFENNRPDQWEQFYQGKEDDTN